MENQFLRTQMLLGEEAFCKLRSARVAVGAVDIIDKDTVDVTNINRQIIANTKTVGQDKTAVMLERLNKISPDAKITPIKMFYLPENSDEIDLTVYDYIIDAIDNVTAKIELIKRAYEANIPIISSMGTGNKLHPEMLEVSDIYKTSVCPLARVMRRELKNRGIKKLKVVYSREEPIKSVIDENGRHAPASAVFVPACAGMILAGEVVRDICGIE